MVWPGITDFSEAVQNPQLCFRGTELESGLLALNQRGMPLVFSGAFACVYSVEAAGSKYAVRCFTREVKDQQSRYNQLSEYLINVLPLSFVHFEYLEHGINLKGDWYPIVRMEWVEGEPLSNFVGANLHDPDALLRVAAQWRGGPCASLRGLRIAHNDLQHGNVMVQQDGRIRLVDYDGMFLPQFKGERSPELGHKNYQHPQRTADDYDAYVDNFPSVVVYLSLLALADDPDLWSYFNDDNLIFTRDDYAVPAKSELFDRLKKSRDETVAKLSEQLEECCAMPVADVPDLETMLQAIPQRTRHTPAAAAPPAPAQSAPVAPPRLTQSASPAAQPAPPPRPTRPQQTSQPVGQPPAIAYGPPGLRSAHAARAQQTTARQTRSGRRPAPRSPTVLCPACGNYSRANDPRCIHCGVVIATGAPPAPTPNVAQPAQPPAAPVAPPVYFPAPQRQLKKVALGVLGTVLAVTAVLALTMAWAVSVRGWGG